jgi:preprotein translocase subunit SecG
MWLLIPALLTIHVVICLLLVLVVLMQLPRSEGLGAAFGGAVTENIFGAQTTHVLARFTVWLGVAFFVVTLALAMAYAKRNSSRASGVDKVLRDAPAATAPAALPSATPAAAPVETESAAPAATPAATEPVALPEATPAASPAVTEPAATPAASPAAASEAPEASPAASPVPANP